MNDLHEALNDKQKKAIRYLSEKRQGERTYFKRQEVIGDTKLTDDEYERLIRFLEQRDAVEIVPIDDGIFANDFSVSPAILDIVHDLDNPPPKDKLRQIITCLLSKWWFVIIVICLIVGSYIVAFVSDIKTILDWFGIRR